MATMHLEIPLICKQPVPSTPFLSPLDAPALEQYIRMASRYLK